MVLKYTVAALWWKLTHDSLIRCLKYASIGRTLVHVWSRLLIGKVKWKWRAFYRATFTINQSDFLLIACVFHVYDGQQSMSDKFLKIYISSTAVKENVKTIDLFSLGIIICPGPKVLIHRPNFVRSSSLHPVPGSSPATGNYKVPCFQNRKARSLHILIYELHIWFPKPIYRTGSRSEIPAWAEILFGSS